MKYERGDIATIKKGPETLIILRGVSIIGGYGERLLGAKVEIIEKARDYGTDCYRIKQGTHRWTIPKICFEPSEITNWKEVFSK